MRLVQWMEPDGKVPGFWFLAAYIQNSSCRTKQWFLHGPQHPLG